MSNISVIPSGGYTLVHEVLTVPPIWPGNPFLRNIGPFARNASQVARFSPPNIQTNPDGSLTLVNPVPVVQRFELYSTGCDHFRNDTYDCIGLCSWARQVPIPYFTNMETLHNCLVAPLIADNFDSLDEESRKVAERFGISPNYTLTMDDSAASVPGVDRDPLKSISRCFSEYCTTRNSCFPLSISPESLSRKVSESVTMWPTWPLPCDSNHLETYGSGPNGSALADCFEAMCLTSVGTVDPDIGGIGFLAFYFIQIAFCLGGFFALRLLDSWASNAFLIINRSLGASGDSETDSRAQSLQNKLDHHFRPLFSALQEFHKSQCFFSIAIEIAALISIRSTRFQPSDPLQIFTNYIFIQAVALNIILCVPFTFWYLRRRSWNSGYNLLLTILSWLLAIATYASAQQKLSHGRKLSRLNASDLGWPETSDTIAQYEYCGDLNPTWNCDPKYDPKLFWTVEKLGDAVLVYPLILGILLFVRETLLFLNQNEIKDSTLFRFQQTCVNAQRKFLNGLARHELRNLILLTIFRLLQITLFAFYLIYFVGQIYTFANFFSGGHIVTVWTIGQVASITVWFQGVSEFIQLELAGMAQGFSHRLPSDYFVERKPKDQ